jgi:hypothetical protein
VAHHREEVADAAHTIERLAELVTRPDVHRRLLGDYRGPYSLGVTRIPPEDGEPALLLRVANEDLAKQVPRVLDVDGDTVRVVVDDQFSPPRPQ